MPITDLITPDYIRRIMAPGVNWIDPRTRTPIGDEVFWAHIDGAISEVEEKIGITLRTDHRRVHEERKDVLEWDGETYWLKKLLKRPLQSVEKLVIGFPNFAQGEINIDRAHITSDRFGQLQILPGGMNFQGPWYNIGFSSATSDGHYWAAFLKVDYRAGFDHLLEGTHSASSTRVTVAGGGDHVLALEPGNFVKIDGGCPVRVGSIISDTEYIVDTPFDTPVSGTAIALKYPGAALTAVGALASLPLLVAAGNFLYGPGVTQKMLHIDGMAQRKGIDPRGPYEALRAQLQARADEAMRTLYAGYVPVRSFSF